MYTGSYWFLLLTVKLISISVSLELWYYTSVLVIYIGTIYTTLNIIHLYKRILTVLLNFLFRLRANEHTNQPKIH